jgi:hypothetical protein
MSTERAVLQEELHSTDLALVMDALRRYAERRTFRDELAGDLLPLLDGMEDDLVVLTCEVLARLRSGVAIPRLADLRESVSPRVAEASTRALEKITGRPAPASKVAAHVPLATQ